MKDHRSHNQLDLKTHTIIFANEYILKERIGGGSFGQIYLALHKPSNELVAIKLESRLARNSSTLSREAKMLSDLADEPGFPKLHFLFRDDEYNAIVLNLLGPNLEKLFKACRYKFSVKSNH
jgi:serine/threonine protein kinase